MNLSRTLSMATLLLGAASAQTFTPLISEGDALPGGAPGELVLRIHSVDVNNAGDWAVGLESDGLSHGKQVALLNGMIVFEEGTTTGIPTPGGRVTSGIQTFDVNGAGETLALIETWDATLGLGEERGVSIIRSGTEIYQEGVTVCTAVGPANGLVFTGLKQCWQNSNDQLLLAGMVGAQGDQILVKVDLDPMLGTVTGETMIALEKETLIGHSSAIQAFSFDRAQNAINDSGDVLWLEDDEHRTGATDSTSDTNFFLNSTLLYNEADAFPAAPLESFDSLFSAEVDLNNNGDFVFSGFDRRPETQDGWLYKSIAASVTVIAHEGDPVPVSVPGAWLISGFGFGGSVALGDGGDVLWTLDWNDPDLTKDSGLMFNEHLVIQEGVTVLDSLLVEAIPSQASEMALSDDGALAIVRLKLAGDLDAAYLVQYMVPGAMEPFCNPAVANSTSLGTQLTGSFLTGSGIGGGMSDLHLECSDGPPGQLGYFLTSSAFSQPGLSISDGQFCLGGAGTQFFRYVMGNPNEISVGFFNGAGILENVAGTSTVGAPGFETGYDVPDTIPGSVQTITTGSTWHFQAWHRDTALGSSHSNFSNGLSVTF
ncbi:MAG: hypothetical protein P1V35_12110 [Planctomycetota bacterium]|nr:hypothetical protein [Planctomycetota bacterium]